MVKKDKTEKHKEIGAPEEFLIEQETAAIAGETKETPEKRELSQDELDHKKVRQELEAMDLDAKQKNEAGQHAAKAQSLDDEKKLEHLLQLVKTKGVVFAVQVAKKMNDPYLLDTFHDKLAQEGYYKEFLK